MPRRRVASPKPSAPVRSAGRQPNATTQSPSAYAAASPQPTRTAIPATVPPATPTSNGPGLFGQMAATAGGVAIGSAVGHAVGNMLTGSGGCSNEAVTPPSAPASAPATQPCEFEWKQFIECTQNQADLSLCEAYNNLFKQCRSRLA
ncbi:unnamed protein product [Dracunculus medinensis]|uniref:CHCH domain-containing protein n=1 Tax=Dracunculus medinensis TaxID=318479 RepID=A0A0N4UA82_DRAME|nr:unnamed protein product [Dracunculus medinensis]